MHRSGNCDYEALAQACPKFKQSLVASQLATGVIQDYKSSSNPTK